METTRTNNACPAAIKNCLSGTKRLYKKKYLFILFFTSLVINILLTSCDNDGYSLGNLNGDYGVVNKIDENNYTVTTDYGNILFPSASNISGAYLKNKDRIIVDYSVLADAPADSPYDYFVKVNSIYKILNKDILPYRAEESDSLGNDPVSIGKVWIANDYITFDFLFLGGASGQRHMVNLVKKPELSSDNRIVLNFRHNAFGDIQKYSLRGLVAFPTSGIIESPQDSVPLRIVYKGQGKDEISFDFTWKLHEDTPGQMNISPKELSTGFTLQ